MASSVTEHMTTTDSGKDVELGFLKKTESWKLRSKFFPSKVGGRPAWLHLTDLPTTQELQCPVCTGPRAFLLQLYAPISELDHAFHRTLYIFFCKTPSCIAGRDGGRSFAVFRSQLPRRNRFYSFHPPSQENEDDSAHPSAEDYASLCSVCGCPGWHRCGKCRRISYCSREHQKMDWVAGHRTTCTQGDDSRHSGGSSANAFLLPEYDIETEPEEEDEEEMTDDKTSSQTDFLTSTRMASLQNIGEHELHDLEAMALREDKVYTKFHQQINRAAEQVLRYQRGGNPLWVSAKNVPSMSGIPPCPCGAPRHFEFQVMPQLLNHLELDCLGDSIDWGTLVVYTCSNSCDSGLVYHPEFLWKQDFSYTDTA